MVTVCLHTPRKTGKTSGASGSVLKNRSQITYALHRRVLSAKSLVKFLLVQLQIVQLIIGDMTAHRNALSWPFDTGELDNTRLQFLTDSLPVHVLKLLAG